MPFLSRGRQLCKFLEKKKHFFAADRSSILSGFLVNQHGRFGTPVNNNGNKLG